MNKNKRQQVQNELKQMARSWPKPNGELVFFMEEDHFWLHKIRLPDHARGEGTKRLAQILALTDKADMLVCLTADPIFREEGEEDVMTNPDTFELVRWYMRFGFIPHGPTEDGFVMERPAKQGSSVQSILADYAANRKKDLTVDEYNSRWFTPKFLKYK